jgi:hypothetical protein
MGLFSFACTICALKTNLALVGVELFLTLCFSLLAGAFFQSAQSNAVAASLQTVRYCSSFSEFFFADCGS